MRKTVPALAVLATGLITGSGLSLTVLPAHATGAANPAAHHTHARALSADRLATVRDRQRRMIADRAPAPTFAKAKATSFAVDTTADTDLADAGGTACVDTGGHCSLRAAVDAANNLQKPVTIVLRKRAYSLSSATELVVTNPAGTSLVGKGRGQTSIVGVASRLLDLQAQSGSPAALLFLRDLRITGGTADEGGGIYLGPLAGSTLVLDKVSVTGNTADLRGGGIYAGDTSKLYARKTTVSNNIADADGAGLYTSWADVNLTGVDITGNHSTPQQNTDGAGWFNTFGVIRMSGGSISGNVAGDPLADAYGGALYDEYGNVTFTDVDIDHNRADGGGDGGGLYASYDLLEVNGGTISHNRATGSDTSSGGGLYTTASEVELHGVRMARNRVQSPAGTSEGGGAIYVNGSSYGAQLSVDGKTRITGSNASAVYLYAASGQVDAQIDGTQLTGNSDSSLNGPGGAGCGGAVCAFADTSGGVNLSMTGDTLLKNASTGDHGSGGITVWATAGAHARAHLLRSTLEANTALAGGLGGALGVNSLGNAPISVRSQGNSFRGNEAGTPSETGSGGAIGVEGLASFFDHGSSFTHNRARGPESWGGAIYTRTGQFSRFRGSRFTKNAASPNGIGHGGAVFTNDEEGTAFDRVSVVGNRSGEYGGGLDTSFEGYEVSVVNSTLSGNVAGNRSFSGAGGGIYVDDGVLTMENTTVAGNRAVQSDNPSDGAIGGGIYSGGGTLGLRYSTVTGNVAPEGGGYYASANGGAVIGSVVSGNHKPSGAEQDCTSFGAGDTPSSLGGNILGQKRCVSAVQSTDVVTWHPKLDKLRDNGGPTKTIALRKKSPAVDRGTFQCPATDQRGHDRPARRCDAGSFELPKLKKRH